jgi:PTS system beta-glucosides-specific IIC component
VTFDRAVIEAAGYPLITPIVILNAKKFGGVEVAADGLVTSGETLLTLAPAAQPAEVGV